MAGSGTAHLRPPGEALISVEHLVVEYETRVGRVGAVSDVSFDVLPGETLGIVGESGCGKSSAARAVIQLVTPTAGTIRFKDRELTTLSRRDLRAVRSEVQIIFQDPTSSLNPRRTVRKIVAEGLRLWRRDSHEPRHERVRQILADVGLDYDTVAERKPGSFSGGQCQRISIARALAVGPQLLVCDEVVSALDVSVQAQILNLLADMQRKLGLTMIFIGHDLAVVKNVSDRIVVMYLGKVCEVGTPEDLFGNPAHPYTVGLLAAVPLPDPTRRDSADRPVLHGDVPSPLDPPAGCRFHTRCPRAEAVCASVEPEIEPLSDSHFVACHFPVHGAGDSMAPIELTASAVEIEPPGAVPVPADHEPTGAAPLDAPTRAPRRPLLRVRSGVSRAARFVGTVLIVTFATLFLFNKVPGDPAGFIAGEFATPAQIQALNDKYHFDDGVFQQYARWGKGLLHADLGTSPFTKRPVFDAVTAALPVTLELTLLAMLLSLVIAVPVALLAARRPGSRFDRVVSVVTSALISVPVFVWAIVLVFCFAVHYRVFPVIGWTPLTKDVFDNLKGAALPVVAIALPEIVVVARLLRAELIATLQQDYIALARSKGLTTRSIMLRHALKPASFSLLTLSGLQLARLLGGTVLVEGIFVLPGIGSLMINSISNRDAVTTLGLVSFIALMILIVNLLIDLSYGWLDPRSRSR
jgi:peptide/nickel transport system ATP-binding protein